VAVPLRAPSTTHAARPPTAQRTPVLPRGTQQIGKRSAESGRRARTWPSRSLGRTVAARPHLLPDAVIDTARRVARARRGPRARAGWRSRDRRPPIVQAAVTVVVTAHSIERTRARWPRASRPAGPSGECQTELGDLRPAGIRATGNNGWGGGVGQARRQQG
jgi:hypothetical protein